MAKIVWTFLLTLCLVGVIAADGPEVKGSIAAGVMFPQMELPHSNAWRDDVNGLMMKLGFDGELEEITPGMGFTIGYGVSVGEYSRFDATVGNIKKEYEVTYIGEIGVPPETLSFERVFKLSTHIVPVRFDYTLFTPGFFNDRVKPELGLGLIFFISKYNTEEKVTFGGEVDRGTAWARGVTVGPELKGGAEIGVFGNLVVEAYGTYFTTVMDLDRWYTYGDATEGPTFEEYTGWAIWVGPRFYWP
jgi:hypothetical protein